MNTLENAIINATSSTRTEARCNESRLRDLNLGITPLAVGNPLVTGMKCDNCGQPKEESASQKKKLLQCARCRMACYCSAECQKMHWKESHKAVCAQLNNDVEADADGKRIVGEMMERNVSSLITLQRNNVVYAMATKYGLLAAMERLFCMEAEGRLAERTPENLSRECYSWTQEIISNVFKGKREVIDRYTCACPTRSREYILSSPTAWDSLMDAALYLAKALTLLTEESQEEVALSHRAARDAFATIELALIHKNVAKALFYRNKATGKRSQSEARDYTLNTMVPKLQVLFRNGGEGFAPDHIDHGQAIRGHVSTFFAMLSYWYRTLDIDPENPGAFVDAMQLDERQETMFEILHRPLGEGMIELGRSLTSEETSARTVRATREYQERKNNAKRGEKKKGGKKKKRR